jgi:hypothetical protein
MSEAPIKDVAELRRRLKQWGTYGPIAPDFHAWKPLPVDEMTDEQVLEAARLIAEQR